MTLDPKIPTGPIQEKWDNHKFDIKLVNPANKRRFEIVVVGTGLAGASAAATLGELGYRVKVITFHDSPRRAHSIAAQGGINAAKNYPNDGDSIYRLFYDTMKGGDYRSREANVYRLAQVSVDIIDQCVAQGVPFAREYGGLLDNRSFGGAQVSRTFYARGQTGQQLLLGAYQALMRQVHTGNVTLYPRVEMLDLVVKDGRAAGIVCRDLETGHVFSMSGHAVVLATGGYGNVFYLSTNAKNSNVTAAWRGREARRVLREPVLHPDPPHLHSGERRLPVEADADVGVVAERRPDLGARADGRRALPDQIPVSERDYLLERRYPSFGNLVARDVASRAIKREVDAGRGVGPLKNGAYLDLTDAIKRLGRNVIEERYGNLLEMYERITDEDPYVVPMRIYPAVHYTMGGLWVDYDLMSNVPGLFVLGEANFADQGANRLGASALMQGLADGYFVLPNTINGYLAPLLGEAPVPVDDPAFKDAERSVDDQVRKMLSINGNRTVDDIHRELGKVLWDNCGMARSEQSLSKALSEIPAIRDEFWKNVRVLGENETRNQSLEKAGRVADFLEFGELMVLDALHRNESCGGHFREEYQTDEGEALRDDDHFSYVAAWEFKGVGVEPELHEEPLEFEYAHPSTRSYK